MTIDSREFRNTLGCFATGITVITTVDREGGPVGFTANSFTALSLDPPLILFCLDRNATCFESFHRNRHFAVNILTTDQQDISSRFAKSGADKWSGVEFCSGESGAPILAGCLANLECQVDEVFEGGDHVIFIGKVTALRSSGDEAQPLLYYRGRYAALGS
jgi:flavin reductase (DIM6/NTAB) family NADH-FMN oxidoreductase RutF